MWTRHKSFFIWLACVAAVLGGMSKIFSPQFSFRSRVQYGGQFDRCSISTCSSPQKTAATQAISDWILHIDRPTVYIQTSLSKFVELRRLSGQTKNILVFYPNVFKRGGGMQFYYKTLSSRWQFSTSSQLRKWKFARFWLRLPFTLAHLSGVFSFRYVTPLIRIGLSPTNLQNLCIWINGKLVKLSNKMMVKSLFKFLVYKRMRAS